MGRIGKARRIPDDALLRSNYNGHDATGGGFWAPARRRGRKTADDAALDADMILAAQAVVTVAAQPADSAIIATTNLRHLELFVNAQHWRDI